MNTKYESYYHRLNRYGYDYQTRMQKAREHQFDAYLARSVYKIDFDYEEKTHYGSFERYKQDETRTLHYLLTNVDLDMPSGTILFLPDANGVREPWMIYYLDRIIASGYNRYIMLRMTHTMTWEYEGETHTSYCYMYGQEDNMLKDEIRSRSRMDTIYAENMKLSFLILPRNQYIKKDIYFEMGEEPFKEPYRVTGYDIQSTEGVEYVSVDPIYEYDLTPPPEKQEGDSDEDFFWLEGGK